MAQVDTTMIFSPSFEPDSPVFSYEDEPDLEGGLRHLSVSSDGTIDSLVSNDEAPTPPQSPHPVVHITPPGNKFSHHLHQHDDDDDMSGHATPTKTQPHQLVAPQTPDSIIMPLPFVGEITPPTPPRLVRLGSSSTITKASSPEGGLGGLAARRAASGKLPNKALLSLQQMRFEATGAQEGLGVGPGSAGFEGMEGISPGGPGLTFRLALGLGSPKDSGKDSPPVDITPHNTENAGLASPSSLSGSPSLMRQSSSSRRRPADPFSSPDAVKIPPSLRGSKILDKLNLSSPTQLHSPLSSSPRSTFQAPASPITRSSAFAYSNTGPLTPLTPSHVPGAPTLSGGTQFDWFSYSMPDSPSCPLPPVKSVFSDESVAPRQAFFLPTPAAEPLRPHLGRAHSHSAMPASPLGTGRFTQSTNPFFSP